MPLLQRSLSDSQLYNKKVSRIVSRIKKQAHLPQSFEDLTHPQTFVSLNLDSLKVKLSTNSEFKYLWILVSLCFTDEKT